MVGAHAVVEGCSRKMRELTTGQEVRKVVNQ